jgi:GGDEF domain-containing protein
MKVEKAAAQDLRGIAANTVRDLALGLRLALLRMESFEPGQGKDAARELAEQLSASARRAVELYYLESLTQAVAMSEGPLQVRRKSELEFEEPDESMEIQRLKSDVTGCYNRLGFTLLLECELERARRRGLPLSLAIFKLDPPSEELVREVAKQGRECCRLLDVLGTFDNLAVGMLLAAQRVLSSYLSARELDGDAGSERLLVGVASHPDDGESYQELLAKADERAGGSSLLEEALEVS